MSEINPPHYQGIATCPCCGNDIEAIEVTERHGFVLGNVLKYALRAGRKSGTARLTDLEKLEWYARRAVQAERKAKAMSERDLRAAQLRNWSGCDDAPVSVMQRDPGDEDDGRRTTAEALWGGLQAQPDSAWYRRAGSGEGLSVTLTGGEA